MRPRGSRRTTVWELLQCVRLPKGEQAGWGGAVSFGPVSGSRFGVISWCRPSSVHRVPAAPLQTKYPAATLGSGTRSLLPSAAGVSRRSALFSAHTPAGTAPPGSWPKDIGNFIAWILWIRSHIWYLVRRSPSMGDDRGIPQKCFTLLPGTVQG